MEVIRSFLTQYHESLQPRMRALAERCRFVHIARKVVGVGSVGTRAWVVLFGRDAKDPWIPAGQRGQALGPRAVHGAVRRRRAGAPSRRGTAVHASCERLAARLVPPPSVGRTRARLLRAATVGREVLDHVGAHACAGDRIAFVAYLGEKDTFDQAVAAFAATYADVNEADHAGLVQAIDDGPLAARTGI